MVKFVLPVSSLDFPGRVLVNLLVYLMLFCLLCISIMIYTDVCKLLQVRLVSAIAFVFCI